MPKKTVNPSQSLKIPKLISPSGKHIAFISPKTIPFICHKVIYYSYKIRKKSKKRIKNPPKTNKKDPTGFETNRVFISIH